MLQKILNLEYPKTKLTILGLLTLDIFIYAAVDSIYSTIDALAWVLLLITYELEAVKGLDLFSGVTLHKIRNGLIVVVGCIFLYYLFAQEWVDVINSTLWLILIALMELEIRYPETVARQNRLYWLATMAVFIGLVAMVFVWLWRREWLDAYDAALWITAFAMIEVDIFRFLQIKKN